MRGAISLLIFLSLLLASCSPRINTSSKNNMESSIEKVRQFLPENKRGKFDVSLQMLIYSQMFNISEEGYPTTNSELNIEKSINGKTGQEIITLAENLQKNWDKQKQEKKEKNKSNK